MGGFRCRTLCNRHLKAYGVGIVLIVCALVYYFVNTPDCRQGKGTARECAQEYMLLEKHTLVDTTVPVPSLSKNESGVLTEDAYTRNLKDQLLKRNLKDRLEGRKAQTEFGRQTSVNLTAYTDDDARRVLKGYEYEDIMSMEPIRYLEDFKNPCWLGAKDNGPIDDNNIHCWPYFYVIGVKKCGTTDIFDRITKHPDVTSPGFKEAQWISRRRFLANRFRMDTLVQNVVSKYDCRKLNYYVHMFDVATKRILSSRTGSVSKETTSKMVTGEGTPAYLHIQGPWDILPGNKDTKEPRFTNLHYIRHLIPQAKLVILFRNPVDRLYSDFLHHNPLASAELFHQEASYLIEVYTTCFKLHPFRQCVYNHSFTDVYPTTFVPAAGFYAFFMKELLNVFPKSQIQPILFDDYINQPEEIMANVFDFLQLRKFFSRVAIPRGF